MRFDFVSLFPEFFEGFFQHSMIRRAIESGRLTMHVTNPRDFSHNKHNQVDDTMYGGGAGMLMMAPPVFEAVESISTSEDLRKRVIFLGPAGVPFTQAKAKQLAESYDQLILICGHYEGVDYRVEQYLADESISIGDYVLTGGELPAMVVADAVARMVPGVLGAAASPVDDSFYTPRLEEPQYTKPFLYRDMQVPDVLKSGDHQKIDEWRFKESLRRTWKHRPDLLDRPLSEREARLLARIKEEEGHD